MSDREYILAGLIHELAVEVGKAMPKEDKQFGDKLRTTEATGESRRVSAQEVSEVVHELVVEVRKAMKN